MSRRIRKLGVSVAEATMFIVMSLPRTTLTNRIKALWLRLMGARVGRRVQIYPRVWIMTGRRLTLGNDVDLAYGVLITTEGGVEIGDRTLVGYNTHILSSNHVVPGRDSRIFDSGHERKPISIGPDAWIGASCVITAGVTIGRGAVIGAGSVVTRDIPEFGIAVGVPAKVIRFRD